MDLIGKTVEIEDEGGGVIGIIVVVTETSVGIKFDGDDCRVWYVPITELKPANSAEKRSDP